MANGPSSALEAGFMIGGRYQIVRPLGEGGMGAVYEAFNAWTQRRVAVKVLRAEFNGDADVVQRFLQEARSTSTIAHPNIVDVLDMGQEPSDGSLFIVQELLDGLDLRDALGHQIRFAAANALALMVPVMDALAAAHARGVLHRDVKPENIFLVRGPDGEWIPKLIDFGIAKVISEDPAHRTRTRTGISLGTPDYMSPEQARGDSNVDARSDVWAVGAVLFELISGRPPFDAPSANLVISRIITEQAPPLALAVPGTPPDVCALVDRALAFSRDARFAGMDAFRDAAMACVTYPAELRARRSTARRAVPLPALDGPPVPRPVSLPPGDPSVATSPFLRGGAPQPAASGTPQPATYAVPATGASRRTVIATSCFAAAAIAILVGALVSTSRRAAEPQRALTVVTTPAQPTVTLPPAPAPTPVPAVVAAPPVVAPSPPPVASPGDRPGNTASPRVQRPPSGLTLPRPHSRLRAIDQYSVQ